MVLQCTRCRPTEVEVEDEVTEEVMEEVVEEELELSLSVKVSIKASQVHDMTQDNNHRNHQVTSAHVVMETTENVDVLPMDISVTTAKREDTFQLYVSSVGPMKYKSQKLP